MATSRNDPSSLPQPLPSSPLPSITISPTEPRPRTQLPVASHAGTTPKPVTRPPRLQIQLFRPSGVRSGSKPLLTRHRADDIDRAMVLPRVGR